MSALDLSTIYDICMSPSFLLLKAEIIGARDDPLVPRFATPWPMDDVTDLLPFFFGNLVLRPVVYFVRIVMSGYFLFQISIQTLSSLALGVSGGELCWLLTKVLHCAAGAREMRIPSRTNPTWLRFQV